MQKQAYRTWRNRNPKNTRADYSRTKRDAKEYDANVQRITAESRG